MLQIIHMNESSFRKNDKLHTTFTKKDTIQFISLVSLHTYFIKISVIPINNKKEINNKRPKESNININKIVYRYN